MKSLVFLLAIVLLAACGPKEEDFKTDVPETNVQENPESTTQDEQAEEENTEDEVSQLPADSPQPDIEIPAEINLTVPFYSQAPEGDWSQPWQDACEESSLILAHYGMKGETLTKEEFKKMVLEMVDWENEHFGYYESTPVEMVVQLYESYFEDAYNVKVIEAPTVDDMKKELAQGNLIVGPFAGRQLGNPFYSGEGPYYHMMVIKGYDDAHFITNDVGTRRGENFIYPYQTILDAMHDYKEPGIESQPARVIVLSN